MKRSKYWVITVAVASLAGACSGSGVNPCENDTVCASQKRVCRVSADGKAVCGDCFQGLFDYEDECLDADACADKACLGRGTCERQGLNNFNCDCDEMYVGSNCRECRPPYQDNDDNGTCEPGCQHPDVSCGDHGVCNDVSGTVVCQCGEGYTGSLCDECDETAGWYPDAQGNGCTNSPLQLILNEPSQSTYTNDKITVRFTVIGPAIDGVDLYLNDNLFSTIREPFTYELDTTMLAEGDYLIHGEATCCDGQTAVSGEVNITVDRTSPTVTDMTPMPGDDNVWIRDEIRAYFSEIVVRDTVNTNSVVLNIDGNPTPIEVALNGNANGITIRMLQDVALPAQAELVFSESITDRAGNPFVLSEPWTWTLPAWQLMTDKLCLVCDDENEERYPFIDVGADDRIVFAWQEDTSENYVYLIVGGWNGHGWAIFEKPILNHIQWPSKVFGVIKQDNQGNPVISRLETTDSDELYLTVARWTGTEWEDLGTDNLIKNPSSFSALQSMTLDSVGNPVLVWYEGIPINGDLWAARWNGQSWDSLNDSPLEDGATDNVGSTSVAMLPNDRPVVAWSSRGRTNNYTSIWVKYHTDGGWVKYQSEPLDFDVASASIMPSIVVDESGMPVVSWLERTHGVQDSLNVSILQNGSFVPLGGGVITTAEADDIWFNSMAISENGTPVVVWRDKGTNEIRASFFDGSAWNELVALSLPAGFHVTFVSFDVDSHDAPVVVVNGGVNLLYRYNKL